MLTIRMPAPILALCAAAAAATAARAEPLSFAEAVARAAISGPTIEASDAAVDSARHAARAAGRLPDPQLVLGLQNVPVEGADAYVLDRDFMTMQAVGVMQEMPSGAERRARRAVALAQSERAAAGRDIARLEAQLGAAEAWIGLHYVQKRLDVLARIAEEARALAAAQRGRLSGGAGSVDELVAAEIEATRVEDERADAEAQAAMQRAALHRWVGQDAGQGLAPDAPAFRVEPDRLRESLRVHPELAAFDAEETAASANLRLARAETAPDWSWALTYQKRGEQFGDMASVEVRIGLPLFQGTRQRPMIEAQRAEAARVGAARRAAERAYAAMLEAQLAEHAATAANLQRARESRLPLARQRAEAVEGAFAGGAASAEQLIVARREALEAELEVIELERRLASLGAALTLQYGEDMP